MLLLFQILVIIEITFVFWIHVLVIDDHAVSSDCGSIIVLPL